jgi:hypothetical protein
MYLYLCICICIVLLPLTSSYVGTTGINTVVYWYGTVVLPYPARPGQVTGTRRLVLRARVRSSSTGEKLKTQELFNFSQRLHRYNTTHTYMYAAQVQLASLSPSLPFSHAVQR